MSSRSGSSLAGNVRNAQAARSRRYGFKHQGPLSGLQDEQRLTSEVRASLLRRRARKRLGSTGHAARNDVQVPGM